MLRGLIWLIFILGTGLVTAPFLLSSLATDERGVTIPGHVFAKSETISTHYSSWTRTAEVTFRYEPPDGAGDQFYKATPGLGVYDALRVGDVVKLHYLRRVDVPAVPGATVLHQLHALPMVRLADQRTFSNVQRSLSGTTGSMIGLAAGIIVGLVILKKSGSPAFKWALGAAVAAGLLLAFFYDFPRPTPEPMASVRRSQARVKSIDHINKVFAGTHARGMFAEQPADVVALEFVPAGRAEPVVAVDLIDSGSVAGLKETAPVVVTYEAGNPRIAHIDSGARTFVSKNLAGMVVQGLLSLGVLIACVAGANWMGSAFNRLVASRTRVP
ncbi:MAG: hypothetical protein JWN34_422 [Bryobacterales bacterium]|nr:hypothetical protein [Bryobacterales bacterium]